MEGLLNTTQLENNIKKNGGKQCSVEDIHAALLIMMKAFHKFCEDKNYTYYTLGGTSLGAYRHKGFIPWDDDMDIGIPREQYNKLIDNCENIPDFLEIKSYHNDPQFPYNFAKLVNKNTTLIEKEYLNHVSGLYIDIFPLDGASSDCKSEEKKQKQIYFWHSLTMSHYYTARKDSVAKEIAKKISKMLSAKRLHKKVDKLLTTDGFENAEVVANYLGSWHEKEVMRKDILGMPTLYNFEDTELYGPEKMEEYLTCLYGDFMNLPPIDEQVARHDYYYLDLGSPFSEYTKNRTLG